MKGLFGYITLFTAALVLAGCSDRHEYREPVQSMSAEFDVSFIDAVDDGSPTVNKLNDYFIDGRSVIIISQRGTSLSMTFNDTTLDSNGNEIPNENLYKYVYYTNDAATWEAYSNFQPYDGRALNWDYIMKDRWNGEYALGALYYPVEYNVYNSVEQDQSSDENLKRSNILGAWHRTNDKTRLRFRFFHLMEAMRVTLLIPEWDPADNSGFDEDAAVSGSMLGMIKEFDIGWSADLSSEEFPIAQYIQGMEPCDITMNLESVDNTPRKIRYNELSDTFPELEDVVRTATFVVLFPPQQPVTNGPAMRFVLKTLGGTQKSYVWSTNNFYGSLESWGGYVNNLTLYLPRKASNAILIKGHILEWIEADSQITVIPDEE